MTKYCRYTLNCGKCNLCCELVEHAAGAAQPRPLTHWFSAVFLPPTKEEVYVFAHVCLSICLSVCEQDYSKSPAWIWVKCCVSTDVGTWTNLLTFEPDPDYSPDAGTGLLSAISSVQVAAARRGFKMALFTASRGNNFVGGSIHALHRVPF